TADLNLNLRIVVCPIVREPDGLALSSRNAYLGAEERRAATVLYWSLAAARNAISSGTRDSLTLQNVVRGVLAEEKLARMDYAEIVTPEMFESVARIGRAPAYVLLAAFIGKTRLIDNLLIEPAENSGDVASSL